jgi:hypothetical protein
MSAPAGAPAASGPVKAWKPANATVGKLCTLEEVIGFVNDMDGVEDAFALPRWERIAAFLKSTKNGRATNPAYSYAKAAVLPLTLLWRVLPKSMDMPRVYALFARDIDEGRSTVAFESPAKWHGALNNAIRKANSGPLFSALARAYVRYKDGTVRPNSACLKELFDQSDDDAAHHTAMRFVWAARINKSHFSRDTKQETLVALMETVLELLPDLKIPITFYHSSRPYMGLHLLQEAHEARNVRLCAWLLEHYDVREFVEPEGPPHARQSYRNLEYIEYGGAARTYYRALSNNDEAVVRAFLGNRTFVALARAARATWTMLPYEVVRGATRDVYVVVDDIRALGLPSCLDMLGAFVAMWRFEDAGDYARAWRAVRLHGNAYTAADRERLEGILIGLDHSPDAALTRAYLAAVHGPAGDARGDLFTPRPIALALERDLFCGKAVPRDMLRVLAARLRHRDAERGPNDDDALDMTLHAGDCQHPAWAHAIQALCAAYPESVRAFAPAYLPRVLLHASREAPKLFEAFFGIVPLQPTWERLERTNGDGVFNVALLRFVHARGITLPSRCEMTAWDMVRHRLKEVQEMLRETFPLSLEVYENVATGLPRDTTVPVGVKRQVLDAMRQALLRNMWRHGAGPAYAAALHRLAGAHEYDVVLAAIRTFGVPPGEEAAAALLRACTRNDDHRVLLRLLWEHPPSAADVPRSVGQCCGVWRRNKRCHHMAF